MKPAMRTEGYPAGVVRSGTKKGGSKILEKAKKRDVAAIASMKAQARPKTATAGPKMATEVVPAADQVQLTETLHEGARMAVASGVELGDRPVAWPGDVPPDVLIPAFRNQAADTGSVE